MPPVKIAPSLLAADFARLADEIRRVEAGGADWLHLDVMDGRFVPNLTIGPPLVECVRKVTRLFLDVHLMIEEPEKFVGPFAEAGADLITFHAEAVARSRRRGERGWAMAAEDRLDRKSLRAVVDAIRAKGKKVGLALNPETPAAAVAEVLPEADLILAMTVWPGFGGQKFIGAILPKIRELRRMAPEADLEVDGGLTPETAKAAGAAGANVIVAGTATFRSADLPGTIAALRRGAESR